MNKAGTNKITIYLLKEGKLNDLKKSLEEIKSIKEIELSEDYEEKFVKGDLFSFYYVETSRYEPQWVKSFFKDRLNNISLFSQSSKGVLLISNAKAAFAVTFGYGYSMIDKIYCEEDFGLKLVLNIVDRDSIRKIGKRTLASEPKNTIEQLSRAGQISDFGIDIEQDLLEEITGSPTKELQNIFGNSFVIGKMSFTILHKINIDNINKFLQQCFEYYKKDFYKDNFSFIDQVKAVKNDDFLNEKLVNKIRGNIPNVKIWAAIPEIINWEEVRGFSYDNKNDNLVSDISYDYFKNSLTSKQEENMSIDYLKNRKITAYNTDDSEYNKWSVFHCLYCEVKENNHIYILSNGKWYQIAGSFVDEIQRSYKTTLANSKGVSLLKAKKDEKENEYNERLAEDIGGILMDRKNISYGGGHSSVEFCDVYDKEGKRFIHVKNYYGSSALSHLFAQGKVSGQLFVSDEKFRQEVKRKDNRLVFTQPNASDFKVIFGIISERNEELNLPFFSKVNFNGQKKLLEAFGFREIYLVKIQRG